jgi:uncharacterized lipoprotein YajG
MFKKLLIIAGIGLVLQGCALTDATLDVGADATAVNQGPLSEAGALSFVVNEFEDAREDKERVGYKKNGFGQNMGDITTAQPVATIVSDAISAAALANGHRLGESGIAVDGVVSEFWVETDINFSNIEMICSIAADMKFTDSETNNLIYSGNYAASYSDKKQMGTEKNFAEIIDGAIQALIDEVVFDEELTEALTSHRAAPSE